MSMAEESSEPSSRARDQVREIEALHAEIEKLRRQNERMQSSMRHCISCEYREEVEASR